MPQPALLPLLGERLRTGKRRLLGLVQPRLFRAHAEHVEREERPGNQDEQKEKAQRANNANLRTRPLPGAALMFELYLEHVEKFLSFLLAESVGLQEIFLAHALWNLQVAYRTSGS